MDNLGDLNSNDRNNVLPTKVTELIELESSQDMENGRD